MAHTHTNTHLVRPHSFFTIVYARSLSVFSLHSSLNGSPPLTLSYTRAHTQQRVFGPTYITLDTSIAIAIALPARRKTRRQDRRRRRTRGTPASLIIFARPRSPQSALVLFGLCFFKSIESSCDNTRKRTRSPKCSPRDDHFHSTHVSACLSCSLVLSHSKSTRDTFGRETRTASDLEL